MPTEETDEAVGVRCDRPEGGPEETERLVVRVPSSALASPHCWGTGWLASVLGGELDVLTTEGPEEQRRITVRRAEQPCP